MSLNKSKFIVVASPRSGSQLFCDTLCQHDDVHFNWEIYNPHRAIRDKKEYKIKDSAEYIWENYAFQAPGFKKMVGFKLLTTQGQTDFIGLRRNWSDVWKIAQSNKEVKIIFLKRRDLLKQYLSQKLAKKYHSDQSNAFSCRTSRVEKGIEPSPVNIDITKFLNYINNLNDRQGAIEAAFKNHDTFQVVFEDFLDDIEFNIKSTFEFLGLGSSPINPSQMIKQENRPLEKAISNFPQLQSYFGKSKIASKDWKIKNNNLQQSIKLSNTSRLNSCNNGDVSVGPETVHVDLMNACQLDCVTCWSHSPHLKQAKPSSWKRGRLSSEAAYALFKDLKKMDTKRVILSGGGEIFLHPNIMDIIKSAKSLGLKITLISNLLAASEDNLKSIVALNVETILANVSACDEPSYLSFHPNQETGAYAKLYKRLNIVKNVKSLKLVQVICSTNWNLLEKMINMAGHLDSVKMQLKLANLSAKGTESFAISKEQRQSIISQLPKLRNLSDKHGVEVNWDSFSKQLQGRSPREFPIEDLGCYSGYYYARIGCNGDVFYCCAPLKVGNIYEESFADIWYKSPQQWAYRQMMREKRFLPVCSSCGKWTLNWKVHQSIKSLKNDIPSIVTNQSKS